jgi:hypothetical protein
MRASSNHSDWFDVQTIRQYNSALCLSGVCRVCTEMDSCLLCCSVYSVPWPHLG